MNRASDVDGLGSSLHTGGSIPMTEHKRRLEKWSNAWKEVEMNQEFEESGSQSAKLTQDQLWAMENKTKKGNIYGLGTEGGKYKNSIHGSITSSSYMEEQLEKEKKMAEEIEELKKENLIKKEEAKKMEEKMQRMMEMLNELQENKKKKKKKKNASTSEGNNGNDM